MKALLFATAALMAVSSGVAFAKGGGGDGGERVVDGYSAPSGFYAGVPGSDYASNWGVVSRWNPQLSSRTTVQPPVAQTQAPTNG